MQEEADQQNEFLKSSEEVATPDEAVPVPAPLTPTALQKQARRARRLRRYDEVMRLHEQGASQITIAALMGLHRDTVRRYLNVPSFPEITRPGKRSRLDPYKAYLQQRWAEGEHTVKHLLVELRKRGYRQGETIVYDYLRTLRKPPEEMGVSEVQKTTAVHSSAQRALSAREEECICLDSHRSASGREKPVLGAASR